MLLELGEGFDVLDLEADLSPYKVVILPDEFAFDPSAPMLALQEKLGRYLASGGKILASGDSGLDADKTGFALGMGAELAGQSPWNPDYLIPTELSPTPPVRGPFVIHGGAWDVRAKEGAQVLARRAKPYFNRAWDRFCSHQHTPDEAEVEYSGAILTASTAYFAHRIFRCYRELGQPLYRDLVKDALGALRGAKQVETSLPTTGRLSLMKQEAENRYVLHLLHAVPVKRGASNSHSSAGAWAVEVIEDLHPVHDVQVSVRVPEAVKSARLVPQGRELELKVEDGTAHFTLDRLECHAMIELAF